MKTQLFWVGKTDNPHVAALCADYADRLRHLTPFAIIELPDPKSTRSLPQDRQKQLEGDQLLRRLTPQDYLVLLDERGKQMTSVQCAAWLQKQLASSSSRSLVFAIGGPYGFSPEVYARADALLSLSLLTFSHQLVRVLFLEQLYRACAINHHLPYHHGK